VFNNAGTFRKSGGTGTSSISDAVTFNNTGTVEVTSGTLQFVGPTAQLSRGALTGGTWKVSGNAALQMPSPITTNAATVELSGPNSAFPAFDSLQTNSGSFTITGGRSFKTAGALNNSGLIAVGPGSALIVAGALSDTGTIDVSGSLILKSTGAGRATALDDVAKLVVAGRNNGAWNGTGIASSAAAGDAKQLTGLAVIPNEQLDGAGNASPLFTTFAGEPVDINSVLVKYTLNGDCNLDGRINFDDYWQMNQGFLSHGTKTGYRWGDINYDGRVNFDDYWLLNQAFLKQGSVAMPNPALAMEGVPEPRAIGALLLAGAMLLGRRRR
jgi:hypothetical protein